MANTQNTAPLPEMELAKLQVKGVGDKGFVIRPLLLALILVIALFGVALAQSKGVAKTFATQNAPQPTVVVPAGWWVVHVVNSVQPAEGFSFSNHTGWVDASGGLGMYRVGTGQLDGYFPANTWAGVQRWNRPN